MTATALLLALLACGPGTYDTPPVPVIQVPTL